MNCETAERWIQSALDGELDPQRTADLGDHLRECAACSSVQRQVQEIGEALRAGKPRLERRPFALNPGLLLLDARRRRTVEDSVVRALRRVAVVAALICVVAGAGVVSTLLALPSKGDTKAVKSMAVSASKSEEDSIFGDDQSLIIAILSSPRPRQESSR